MFLAISIYFGWRITSTESSSKKKIKVHGKSSERKDFDFNFY